MKQGVNLLCVLGLVLGSSGCATPARYEAEVARQRALSSDLVACKQRALDVSKTREKLLLEKQSLDQERLDLIAEIESERSGIAEVRTALEAERAVRSSKEAEIQQLSGTYQNLVEQLESEVRSGDIEIEELRGRLQVRALDQILFDSGSVEIKPRGREVLAKIAAQLAKVSDRRVLVEAIPTTCRFRLRASPRTGSYRSDAPPPWRAFSRNRASRPKDSKPILLNKAS